MEIQIDDQTITHADAAPTKGPLQLLFALLALAVLVLAALIAIVLLIPDENDYAKSVLVKHQRLESLTGPKVVMIGGSNLAYGFESERIEQVTGLPAVNMGMNGYFGSRYMLNEVKGNLKSGDVVVIAFEWDNFSKSVDGSATDLFVILRTKPSAFAHYTPKQAALAASALPSVAQAKALRIIRDSVDQAFNRLGLPMNVDERAALMNQIESVRHFDTEGDLNGHTGIDWGPPLETSREITTYGLNTDLIRLIKDFAKEMNERGVTTIMSYTPTMREYYETQKDPITEAHRLLTSGPDAVYAPRPPEAFVFDKSYFFDNVYHLRTTTRGERTQMVAEDINRALTLPTATSAASERSLP
ncbi:hypothetical protein [uncultured Hyphomonas sp.]|uniref:hypothetical protein n=1 Tax=uncultured Hyphomonas sp. TaxID=225298 RepID=UPI002AABF395|nr:hypothetical protein [uncultured Hyphomonas sp.]